MSEPISLDEFRAAGRRGEQPAGPVQKLAVAEAVPIEGAARTIRMTLSDGSTDRMGDKLDPAGWELGQYRRNPVVLWSHDATSPPIGRCTRVWVQGDRLMGDLEFAPPEIYEFADTVYKMVRDRWLSAGSVGFQPIEWSWSRDASRPGGIDFRRQELLEFSVCPVPANPGALVDGRSVAAKALSPDKIERAATIERLQPARRPSAARADLGGELTPLGFCGRWIDEQRERDRRETRRRLETLLRRHISARPETEHQREAWGARFVQLRRLVEAWR
jgi:HK97 family phage prohead protease